MDFIETLYIFFLPFFGEKEEIQLHFQEIYC
jgi:hypothetical protein